MEDAEAELQVRFIHPETWVGRALQRVVADMARMEPADMAERFWNLARGQWPLQQMHWAQFFP